MGTSALKILTTILASGPAVAFASADNAEQSGNGMLIWGFIGFAVVLLLSQAAAAVAIFYSMVKGLFFATPVEVSFLNRNVKNNK